MILRLVEKVYIALAGVWFFIILWCAILGLPQVPAWNSFILWYSSFQPDIEDFTSFMEVFRGVMTNLSTLSGEDLQRVANPDATEVATIFQILAVLFDTMVVFLRTIGNLIVGFFTILINTLVYVVPQVGAFVAFLTGTFFTNLLAGAGGVIDWSANSGWLGYPDQSFANFGSFVPALVS